MWAFGVPYCAGEFDNEAVGIISECRAAACHCRVVGFIERFLPGRSQDKFSDRDAGRVLGSNFTGCNQPHQARCPENWITPEPLFTCPRAAPSVTASHPYPQLRSLMHGHHIPERLAVCFSSKTALRSTLPFLFPVICPGEARKPGGGL
jgi:hypothetical protein